MDRRSGGFAPGRAPWRVIAFIALFSCPLLALASPAAAQFHVVQPDVVKGEATVGDHAAAYVGPGTEEKLRQGHEVEATYDFTERWELVAKGIFQQPIGEPLEAKNYQLGAQYELVQRHGDGVGLAFRTLYEFAAEGGQPDDLFYGPMARLVLGKDSATINAFFISQVGENADPGSVELKINWQLRRDLGPKFGLGVEGYTDIKDLADAGSFEDQEHRLGPVLYLDLGKKDAKEELHRDEVVRPEAPSFRVAAGALFGLSEATSDVTFKLDVSAAFY
jgi:hypothetical protein